MPIHYTCLTLAKTLVTLMHCYPHAWLRARACTRQLFIMQLFEMHACLMCSALSIDLDS